MEKCFQITLCLLNLWILIKLLHIFFFSSLGIWICSNLSKHWSNFVASMRYEAIVLSLAINLPFIWFITNCKSLFISMFHVYIYFTSQRPTNKVLYLATLLVALNANIIALDLLILCLLLSWYLLMFHLPTISTSLLRLFFWNLEHLTVLQQS